MQGIWRASVAALAALLGFGLFAVVQSGGASADEPMAKREDSISVLVTDDSDDDSGPDDDTGTRTRTRTGGDGTFDSRTGDSNDGTNSRVTAVSRDRDLSRDDRTKDRTMDGGDPTRDHTRHHTNDGTRNDTR